MNVLPFPKHPHRWAVWKIEVIKELNRVAFRNIGDNLIALYVTRPFDENAEVKALFKELYQSRNPIIPAWCHHVNGIMVAALMDCKETPESITRHINDINEHMLGNEMPLAERRSLTALEIIFILAKHYDCYTPLENLRKLAGFATKAFVWGFLEEQT